MVDCFKMVQNDLDKSRSHEMQMYLGSLKAMYENALAQNGEIYDIAKDSTNDFREITAESIIADSRIIKILRYAIAPSISQMKFGQFFGFGSIDKFENDILRPKSAKYNTLCSIADQIAKFATDNLDRERFIWVFNRDQISDLRLASDYAKGWTCSIAADQNAQTRYRNWRKDQQEHSIASTLLELGYTKSSFRGLITKHTDIKIGEYTQEQRVRGRTRQKADLIARSKKTEKLVLIEAKAVGVELDSTKRIKECCDKSNDWRSSTELDDPVVAVVIAGFFNSNGIENLLASNISVIWEHRLSDLSEIL
jgi:hypothetical protein